MFNRIKKLRKEIDDLEIEVDRAVIIARRAETTVARERNMMMRTSSELARDLGKRLAALEYAAWPPPSDDTRSRPQLPDPKLWSQYQQYVAGYQVSRQQAMLNYPYSYSKLYRDECPVTYPEYVEHFESRTHQTREADSAKRSARSASPYRPRL
jgi:hypothetical protein